MERQFLRTNRQAIRGYNRHLILNTIKRAVSISQHEICQKTKIRPATVINLLKELKKEKYIQEVGLGKSTGGRPPKLLELNPKARYVIGVHFDGIRIRGIVTDLKGETIYQREAKEKDNKLTRENVIPLFSEVIKELVSKLKTKKNSILGIGIGVPGLVDRTRGIGLFYTNFPWWRDIPFKASLEKKFSLGVEMENDTRVLTLAEKWYGMGKGIDNFLYADVGPGIALGIFLNGTLYRGGKGMAGEFGHTTITSDGAICSCGKRGCLEAVASTTVLKNKMDIYSWPEIRDEIVKGEEKVKKLLKEEIEYLSLGLGNVINIFNPSLMVIGGEISQIGDFIGPALIEKVKTSVLERLGNAIEIKIASFNPLGGARGATTLILEEIFDTS